MYISLMLAAFFSFLHDTVDLKNAKRLYGFIVLGAVSGGAIGSTYFRGWIKEMTNQQWLHLIIGIGIVICILAALAGWMAKTIPHNEPDPAPDEVPRKNSTPPSRVCRWYSSPGTSSPSPVLLDFTRSPLRCLTFSSPQ